MCSDSAWSILISSEGLQCTHSSPVYHSDPVSQNQADLRVYVRRLKRTTPRLNPAPQKAYVYPEQHVSDWECLQAGRAFPSPSWHLHINAVPTEQPTPASHTHWLSGSPWDRTQQIILIFPLPITMTTLPTHMFSFICYCEIFLPLPVILRILLIFSFQSFVPFHHTSLSTVHLATKSNCFGA